MPEGSSNANWSRLATDAHDLLGLAAWLGHLRRSQRNIAADVPPAHWIDLLAAFLVHDGQSSRWVQAAADADLLNREQILPAASLVRDARWRSLQGEAPPTSGQDGLYT